MPNKFATTNMNAAPKFFGKGRSRHDLSHNILVTGNTGDLIVTMCEPVVPGSTMSLRTASLTRLETSLHQTLDNAYVETGYFFVPSRELWRNFDKYQGYNSDAWARTLEFKKPQYYLGYLYDDPGSATPANLADHVLPHSLINDLYCPVTKTPKYMYGLVNQASIDDALIHLDLLPLRGVFKIYNDYFRDQNYDSEIYYDDGEQNGAVSTIFNNTNTYDQYTDKYVFNGGYFEPSKGRLKVNRLKDTFSTALPQPQKGDPISLLLSNNAPVGVIPSSSGVSSNSSYLGYPSNSSFVSGEFKQAVDDSAVLSPAYGSPVIADLSGVNFTVNDLRIAIALQSMRERDARSGNRLNEKLYGTWHIQANSLELDRAEYLGGKRIPVTMMEVLQTSETGNTVLGSDAGHSKTFDSDDSFVKTFTQWGYVIGFIWVRTDRSYSQGIDRKFLVQDILDEYDPMLDSISEQPVYKFELQGMYDSAGTYNVAKAKKVFGYQEAWYQYKRRNNRFYGMFQPGIQGSLADWHYGDDYTTVLQGASYGIPTEPFAGPSWLKEGPENVDRTIAVASDAAIGAFQWKFNLHFELYNTFESSVHSKPNTFGF